MYRSQTKCYLNFCFQYGQIPVPASQETLCFYMSFLARTLNPSSIPGYMNVIRFFLHSDSGFENPLQNNWELKLLHRGISRLLGVPPKQKLPITIEILLDIAKTVNDHPSDTAFCCVCLLAFYGFMRKSTLIPMPDALARGKFIARGDVKNFTLKSFTLEVKHSKTIQFGQKVHSLPFVLCSDARLCPLRALLRHLGVSALASSTPLFDYVVSGCHVNFSHSFFIKRLRLCLVQAGRDPKEISCHSFRRGGATLAYLAGLSPADIKLRGDWASSAYEKYLCVSSDSTLNSAHALSLCAASYAVRR